MAATDFSRFCTPAQLYLILAGISLITAFFNDFQVITLVVNSIFVLFWGWILNWLCSKGFKAISWILVLLPFILFIFTFFFAKDILAKSTIREGGPQEDAIAAAKAQHEKLQAQRAASIARPMPGANRGGVRQCPNGPPC